MSILNLKKAIEQKSSVQKETPNVDEPAKEATETPIIENSGESTQNSSGDENANKLDRLNSEELLHLDMSSVREAVGNGDMRMLRKAGEKIKKNKASDLAVLTVSDEEFLKFKTFVPVSGNVFGKEMAHGKAVHLSVENEHFIKRLMFEQDVRKNAVVNHIIDMVRIHFKK
ncbi:MAG: hypothetical protein K2X69_15340 [Silvanigrellaceae bacterium]|nr:hypothetical protein [Silvanigrellaceae bacterium]